MAIMPDSSANAVVRPDLAGLLWEYAELLGRAQYIGLRVAPLFEIVDLSTGYLTVPTESLLKIPDTKRSVDGSYNRVTWEYSRNSFAIEEHGLEHRVDDKDARAYANYFDAEEVGGRVLMGMFLLDLEKRILDMLQDTGTFTAQDVVKAWATVATADPLNDVNTQRNAIRDATGLEPNCLIVSPTCHRNFARTVVIQGWVKYTGAKVKDANMSEELMSQYFDIPNYMVARSRYDTAKEGATASLSGLWAAAYAMVCRIPESVQNIADPCVMRTFLWTGDSPENVVVESYRDDPRRGEVLRVRNDTDEAIIMAACARLIDTTSEA